MRVTRIIHSLAFLIAGAVAAGAQEETPLSLALQAARAGEWEEARALAVAGGPVASDIVEWQRLREGEGDFDALRAFLARNGDWPGVARARNRGEEAIPEDADPLAVVDFFDGRAPATGAGGVRLTRAYAALGRRGDAEAQAVLTWRSLPLTASEQAVLFDDYGPLLAPHHTARLDAMLWQGADDSARLVLDLVPKGWRTLAVARMTLRSNGRGVDKLIAAVPEALSGDAGLAWARFDWRARKGRAEEAAALLDDRSFSVESLGEPARWADRRRRLARQMMREGKAELAYRLAANHFLTDGIAYADLEWLAGFIALRQLDEPALALAHFQRFEVAVKTPISLGRAYYWQGLALETLGRPEEAEAAFARAARYQTGFYGQLAAERAGVPMTPELTGDESYPDWKSAPFAGSTVLKAALLFLQADERGLAAWFMSHLARGAGPEAQAQLAGLALSLDEPYVALSIAKVAAREGNILPRAYFPVTAIAEAEHPVPTELVLSIARRESEFNAAVISPAGARGLMQLMPGTAREVSAALSLDYSAEALLSDPGYNATLGASYLNGLIEEFGPNYVLVAAAYNAGPTRVRRWIAEQGDPRAAGVDVVDWIERIPFRETRNYVMRVSESLMVYRARLSGTPQRMRLSEELKAF